MNEYNCKLCIFDLDGTLIDTIDDLGESVSYALTTLGLPTRTREEYLSFVGNGTYLLVQRSLPEELKENTEILDKAFKLFSDHYDKNYANKTAPYEGILEVVEELKNSGVKVACFTNKPQEFAVPLANKFFKEGTFEFVYGVREGYPKKPDPAVELDIMANLGVSAEETIHIGDSDVDVHTAKNAGVKCIACTWGFRSEESLVKCDPEFLARKPQDILKILSKKVEI